MESEVPRPRPGSELDPPASVFDEASACCQGVQDDGIYPQVGHQHVACLGVESDHVRVWPRLAHRVKTASLMLNMTDHIPEASVTFDIEYRHRPGPIIRDQYETSAGIQFDMSRFNPT
jgi:hypothetical protein